MESCLLDLAKNEVQSLVNLVKKEAQYLCCYNIHVKNFKQKKDILVAKHKDVKRKFQKGKGVFSFKFEAQQWEGEAEGIIHIDTKIKKKLFFGWCLNCWSLYRKGKELAEEAQHIEKLLERCNSNITEGRANVLDIKYLSSHDFLHFKSRESKFQDLLKALQDENCNMVELQGLGGTGKTSMAKEVHDKLKESKLIDKSIFLVVSQFPDFKKIRGEVAKSLYLNLDEEKEDELSSTILSRITNMDEKLLIILDDVWVKFDLEDKLGIPYGDQRKGCKLLITTRSSHLWTDKEYQTIQIQMLTEEEAFNLFEAHASLNNSHRGFKGMPQKIVKHCAGLPVAIVALARALKNKPISVWKDALKTLEEGGLVRNLEKAYTCLKFSYDNLKSQKAKELLLISSMFREDFEIPIKLLIKIGIGLGSFNENDKYHLIRSEVHETIEELIHSSLLLNDEEECVKMHDLVREVALWIGENDIQSLLDLEKPIKGNLRYMCCMTNKFPDEIDGNKLEYLSIFLDDPGGFNVSDTFFKNMTSIKVLILANDERGPALSLTNSFQPLKSLQMLTLVSLEVGDISVLRNVLTLVTLWFLDCSIVELPKEFSKLKKLRSLDVCSCEIKRNNPFEVIEMCSQLEELTFVGNKCEEEEKDAISHNGSPLTLHRYCISYSKDDYSYYSEENGFSRCFRVDELSNLVSNATCKQLVERAEVLWLEKEDDQRMWNNLVPDIVPIDKEGVMNDLIVLHLSSRPNMKCLIHTKSHHPHVTAFRNLAELHLYEMGIEDLYRGPPPSEFLEQLEILRLRGCYKLKSILFNGNYNLCHLKSMELEDCPMLMSVFQPSTAPCLKKLEELTFRNCGALEYIIAGEDGDSNQISYYDSLFPSLKELTLSGVPSFIGIVREYDQLSRHNSRNLNQSLSTHAFSWVPGCCSLNKLRPASKEPNITISEDRSLDRTKPLKFDASIDRGAHSVPAQSLLLQSLKNVRKIILVECHNIISLSTLSIATSTIALETLTIWRCHKLKCITTNEGDAQVDRNYCAIFPTLEKLEITDCKELEFLFVSAISVGLQKLKSLTIEGVPELKCVFGNNQKEQHSSNQNQSDALHFDLPALETFYINVAPKINNIFVKNYSMVNWVATEEVRASTIGAPLFHVTQNLWRNIREIELVKCTNLISLTTLSSASIIMLEVLTIRACDQLKCIVGDEGDARTQINYNSIFPKLKQLELLYCDALEYLFPAYAFRSPVYLESLKIKKAPLLKYVFERSQHDDSLNLENQNIQTLIDFPVLKDLSIKDVPKLVSIYPENYYMRGLYLRSVILKELPEFTMRHFNEFSVWWHTEQQETKVIEKCWKTLDFLKVCDFKIEEIFYLTYVETEKKGDELQPLTSSLRYLTLLNLSELVNICVGPKCIICFDSLQVVTIKACKKLRVIFSASIVRSLPVLEELCISECEELVHIVEEDYETNADDHVRHEPCFPNLERVYVSHCDKLKYLFSITTSDILPKLYHLEIYNAFEFEHVLIKRDEMEEIVMKDDVLPQLGYLVLFDLPNLISVCHGINFQKKDYYYTQVSNCPNFDNSTTQHEADHETGNSQIEEKAEERLSSHMGEEIITQQSFTKGATKEIVEEDFMSEIAKMTISSSDSKLAGQLVDEARAKSVSSNTLYQISLTSEKEVPIHTSLSLTALPTRDNTHACAKIFEDEEQEQGCLITSRRLRSGIKASSPLLEDKLETSIDAVTTILSEQTSQAILSSKASTSINQASSSFLSKSSDGVDHGGIKVAGMVQNEYKSNVEPSSLTRKEQESSYSKGQIQKKDQLIDSQPISAMPTTSFVTISQDEDSEGGTHIVEIRGEEGALILETPHPSSLTFKESDKELNPSAVNRTDSQKAYSKDELGGKEVQKETTIIEAESQQERTGHDIQFHKEEEEEREDDVQLPNKSQSLAIDSSGSGDLVPNITHAINSLEGVNYEGINEASVVQNESKTNVTCHGDQANPSNITQIEQETSHCRGQMVESRDCTESDFIEDTKLSVSPFYTPIKMMPSFLETNNEASIVPGVQKIIHMMELEGFESLIFAKALETRPQLQLSTKDRSARVLCMSYRVLLDILNILTTKTPFTITEADKRLLAEHLKDAYLLGFDKDWIESIKTKVFDNGIYEVDSIQKVLKGLDNDLKSNEAMLEVIRDKEVEAARVVEVAQQEHANVMARHANLLKERQYIIAQRRQCWELIAAKNRHFGF